MPSLASSRMTCEHLRDELRVEGARHLVEQHQARLHRERAHDRDALLLAAGEPVRDTRRACRRGRSGRAARRRAPPPPPSRARAPFAAPSVMFSSTDMCGKRLKDWKTIPIPRRTAFTSTPGAVISSPRTTIRPASIGSSRFTQRSSVDFPEPDAPMRQTTSCSASSRSMPRSTSSFPKDLRRPSISQCRRAHASSPCLLAALVARDEPVGEARHRDRERDEDDRRRDVRRVVERRGDLDLRLPERLDDAEQRRRAPCPSGGR